MAIYTLRADINVTVTEAEPAYKGEGAFTQVWIVRDGDDTLGIIARIDTDADAEDGEWELIILSSDWMPDEAGIIFKHLTQAVREVVWEAAQPVSVHINQIDEVTP